MNKIFLAILVFTASCQNFDYQGKGKDVPTTGKITIGADYGDSFVLNELIDVFEDEYQNADIQTKWHCETDILRYLQSDSLRFVLLNRDFTKEEKDGLVDRDIQIRSVKIASSSIAVIVNPTMNMDKIKDSMLFDILTGQITRWPDNGNSILPSMDKTCGSIYNFLSNHWNLKSLKCNDAGIVNSPREVIEFVANNTGAIGFVNLNWIADKSDSMSILLGKKVKVLQVQNKRDNKYYYPYQSQIKANQYPFIQHLYLHDLQGYSGLAKGFMAFVSSQPGQILVKKSGLVPAKDHGRTIVIGDE